MHSPKAQCPWGGNDNGMQPLEQGTREVPRQRQGHSGFCGKGIVPSSQGKKSCQLIQGWLQRWGPDASLDMEPFPGQWDRPCQISRAKEKPI